MAEENKDQKTEKATSKRLRETEEKGQFANSRELTSTLVLFAALMSFLMLGQKTTFQIMEIWIPVDGNRRGSGKIWTYLPIPGHFPVPVGIKNNPAFWFTP